MLKLQFDSETLPNIEDINFKHGGPLARLTTPDRIYSVLKGKSTVKRGTYDDCVKYINKHNKRG